MVLTLQNGKELGNIVFNKKFVYKERILKPSMDAYGYFHVRLIIEHGKYKLFKVHRLVAKHFLPDYSETLTVNHINFDKADNRVDNLQMMTREENIKDWFERNKSRHHHFTCEETGERFNSFKAWCKRNGVLFNRYQFKKSCAYGVPYMTTGFHFKKED